MDAKDEFLYGWHMAKEVATMEHRTVTAVRIEMVLFYVLGNKIVMAVNDALCAVFGHRLVDFDPGDHECGPVPTVICTRCGRVE